MTGFFDEITYYGCVIGTLGLLPVGLIILFTIVFCLTGCKVIGFYGESIYV